MNYIENNTFKQGFFHQVLSRHEKRCRMCARLFCLFQCSRNQQCTFYRYITICFPPPLWFLDMLQKKLFASKIDEVRTGLRRNYDMDT